MSKKQLNRYGRGNLASVFRSLSAVVLSCFLIAACDAPENESGSVRPQEEQAQLVHVYNWSDYMASSVLTQFEQETGIKVVYDVFDSNELLETKLLAGGSGYDVVVPTAIFLQRQIKAGVFQPLKHELLPNWDYQWPAIMRRTADYDPGNRYAVNYMWGTTGIGYNRDMILERLPEAPLDSWEMVFNPDFIEAIADCGVYFLDAPEEMLPLALNYLHHPPDSQDLQLLAEAEALLATVRPYVRKFHSSEYINALANGDICLAVGWSGDVFQARQRALEANNGVAIDYSVPKEGTRVWFDMMAIPVDAPHPENAHRFIDFLLRPEIMAKISNEIYFANGNLASQKFLNQDVIADPLIYPSEETVDQLFTVTAYGVTVQRDVSRLWSRLKQGESP